LTVTFPQAPCEYFLWWIFWLRVVHKWRSSKNGIFNLSAIHKAWSNL
jgi:hypothetical protein